MEEDGALEHSLAFAGTAKNSAGGIYKKWRNKTLQGEGQGGSNVD
jgi:hypothetical protein